MADPTISMTPVTSSQLHSVGYDIATKTLRIRFKGRTNKTTGEVFPDAVYEYDDVPPHVHAGLMAADADPALSVGSYFGRHIKAGGYAYRKIIK